MNIVLTVNDNFLLERKIFEITITKREGRCAMLEWITSWVDGIGVKKSVVTVVVVAKLKTPLQPDPKLDPPVFCAFQALATNRNSSAYGVIFFSSKDGLASLEVCKEKYDSIMSGDQINLKVCTGRFSAKKYFKLAS
ncbi:hypothetical protein C0416_01040 [bacterium]|nr:hypothetical protein [bacterium]